MDPKDEAEVNHDLDSTTGEHETHATTGGAAAAGAVTGGVIGLAGGPIGAAIGAVGGAIVAAAAERMMHSDDDTERARAEANKPTVASDESDDSDEELASP
jgi:outer membrane lipoprotein SlyB